MIRFLFLVACAAGVCVFVISTSQEGDVLQQVEKAYRYCSSCAKKLDVEIEIKGVKKH